ncbi:MAG: YiiX/YebB-like N1pC/P60 family cysteine hydrolase [Alphaproteobacteria bacterium]|nr:YiiX/YebB-like N1pC/P60 family cysteine hydrolase [Alphaproteobacteria bacterium]
MTDAAPQNKNRRRRMLWAAVLLAPLLMVFAVYLWLWTSWADTARLPPLRDGDVVFNTSTSRQSLAVGLATQSLLTHVGFIRHRADVPYVIEASSMTGEMPLTDWIGEGYGGRLLVMRPEALEPAQFSAAARFGEAHFGKPYDIFFAPGHDAFYCSELVHDAFAAGGVTLGRVQKLRDLHLTSAPVRRLIGERWARHPHCKDGAAKDADDCLSVIGTLDIVTPVSLARDKSLHTVYSNYPF